MNVTKDSLADKSLRQSMEQAESLRRFVVEAVGAGKSLHDIERGVLEQVLIMGRHAIDATLRLQGDGDLGGTLDIVHVSAYVWEAAGVLCTNEKAREDFTRSRLLTILRGGAKSVIRGLRHMATARDLRGDDCRQITTITNYLAAHIDRLRYDEHLAAG